MLSQLCFAFVLALAPASAAGPTIGPTIGIDDCPQCTPTTLCASHLEAQAAAIKELKPKLKSKDAMERTSTLKKLAALNAEHLNVPSTEIANLVAGALQDESNSIKTEAARLLGEGLQPEVAVKALVGGLDDYRKEAAKSGGGKYGGGNEDASDPKVIAQRKLRTELQEYAKTIVAAMANLPDDRCVEALSEQLSQLTRRSGADLLTPIAETLLKFESRPGVEAIVQKIKSTPPGGGGKWGPDTTGRSLHEILEPWAKAKGLADMPKWNEKEPPDWETWLAKNQSKFPAKIGKCDVEKAKKARDAAKAAAEKK